MPKQTYLFTAVYLCGFQLLLLCGVLVAPVRVLRPYFPDIWFSIYCILLAKRNVQQKIPSTCQGITVEE